MTPPISRRRFLERAGRAALAGAVVPVAGCGRPGPRARASVRPTRLEDPTGIEEGPRLEAVRQFADVVLAHGRDRFGSRPTPLFADGLVVETRDPVVWTHDGEPWICSNLASQQTLLRTLVGASRLTGDPAYLAAARGAIAFHFGHLTRSCGLLQWGGHRFIDLRTGRIVGEQDTHEIRGHFPFLELLYDVAPNETTRMIRALWNAHVLDWRRLDLSRHGTYDRRPASGWDRPFAGFDPYFEGTGLPFIGTGMDLSRAAAFLHARTGEAGALSWGRRLARYYVEAGDPDTGLLSFQYSRPLRRREPPEDPNDPRFTYSAYGDRAARQFGPEFGERALEGRVLDPGRADAVYGQCALAQLGIAELLGEEGAPFLEWMRRALIGYARLAYDPGADRVIGVFTDGTPIRPEDVVRPGFFAPQSFRPRSPSPLLLLSYATAHRHTGDPELWTTVRAMGRGRGLGDLGRGPGDAPAVDLDTAQADPHLLLALLEVYRSAPAPEYLDLARALGDNILAHRFRDGLFTESPALANASFDRLEPLALLSLEATIHDRPGAVPPYTGGRGYILGPHDGFGRTLDARAIWSVRRG